MYSKIKEDLQNRFVEMKEQGIYKTERIITSSQSAHIKVAIDSSPAYMGGEQVLNFCANNYLGLANHPSVIKASQDIMNQWGYGLSSVRFICGTQQIHKELEKKMSEFLGTEDTILYVACFDANTGLFETILDPEKDAVISDELNHASIIDGVRLFKSQNKFRYKHSDMAELEKCLQDSQNFRYRLIITDGVFSMDGDIAKLDQIVDLADKYDALVAVDDSHSTGYIGPTGKGTAEYYDITDRVDIITTTFGKALGGANGGCTSGKKEIIELLRQKSRPYLFSNTVSPAVVGGTLEVLNILEKSQVLISKVKENAKYFREMMEKAGFDLVKGNTAIVPVMIYDEPLAIKMADMLLKEGIYVIGFTYPVVARGRARIRVQLSAAHSKEDIDKAVEAFIKVGKDLGVLK
ncbi:MAG: glycine C-acetyltransferase [Candidatus Cloacimonetes bacterium]|nr:glycine C-acetyltransferase [Candidatus Cloacimonadota bacterium]